MPHYARTLVLVTVLLSLGAGAAAMEAVDGPMSRRDVVRLFMPFVAFGNVGHAHLAFPVQDYIACARAGGTLIPIDIRVQDGRTVIAHDYSGDPALAPGTELVALGDRSAAEWGDRPSGYTAAERPYMDRHSCSNATVTAAIIQDYGFGKVVGEETSDLPATYASSAQFTLPDTGIAVTYPKGYFVRPSGDEGLRGVVPDHAIDPPPGGTEEDVVLRRTLDLVRPREPKPQAEADIARVVDAYADVYGFSGAVLVAARDAVVYDSAHGHAERALGIANRPSLRFPINSISKTFVAAAVLVLVDDGALDLEAPLSRYLPELEVGWADRVTPHHLLSHTSGLPREFPVAEWEAPTLAEQTRRIAGLELGFEPGARYSYANPGYALLGRLIEVVSGRSYGEFLCSRVLEPAGLMDTGLVVGQSVVDDLVHAYAMGSAGVMEMPKGKHLGVNPGGGLYSTTRDLHRWMRALEQAEVLPDSMQTLLFTPHAEEDGPDNLAGYAWALKRYAGDTLRMAAGSGSGSKSAILRDPQSGLFIAVLSNWGDVPVLNLLRDLLFAATGAPVQPPTSAGLADPADYDGLLGTYVFDPGVLSTTLGIEADSVTLLAARGRLYLTAPNSTSEILRATDEGGLQLTYTDELVLDFERDATGHVRAILVRMNDRELRGVPAESMLTGLPSQM